QELLPSVKARIVTSYKKIALPILKTKYTKVYIDDFATKKHETYGTVIIDIYTHRIIDMIPSKEHQDVASWLKTFPNIALIARDGSNSYTKAIKEAHPHAIQVSDRFHLLKNLTTYCKKALMKYFKSKVTIPAEELPSEKRSEPDEIKEHLPFDFKIEKATELA